ncbi:MAG: hypothetical protein RLZZ546_2160 [Bacteroidota bacterium]|jgi:hypothetical protein
MQNSKQLLKQANIMPRLRLAIKDGKGVKGTGPHRVKIISDKIVKGKDFEGNVIEKMRYILEEDGVQKMYECLIKDKDTGSLHYLVQRIAEFNEGDELIMEYKRKGLKGYIEVLSISGGVEPDEQGSEDPLDDFPEEEIID